MTNKPTASVQIYPGRMDKRLLSDVIEAMRHVEYIMAINDDDTIQPGALCGMSRVLCHAERTLGEMRAALPAMPRRRRAPTCESTAWQGAGETFSLG